MLLCSDQVTPLDVLAQANGADQKPCVEASDEEFGTVTSHTARGTKKGKLGAVHHRITVFNRYNNNLDNVENDDNGFDNNL